MPKSAIGQLEQIAAQIHKQLNLGMVPEMNLPTRSKANIIFDQQQQVWKYGKLRTTRTAKKLDGAYMLLRTTYLLDFIRDMVGQQKSSTLRELYYISEGWDLGKFHSQDESNKLIEDLEIITNFQREDFKIRPEEDGAKVLGDLTLTEINRKGKPMRINCRDDVGDTGYGIPYNVEPEKITFNNSGNARCIIAIETGGMFDRLVENGFDESHGAILVHIKGQPARSTRRFLQRLSDETSLPLLVFTDADPWSYRIYGSIAYGAIKTAHISHLLATPSARYLGVTPSDITNYELPHDELTERDRQALKSMRSDPRFLNDYWSSEIELQLEMGLKAEQQALAKYGLDFVTDTYLPEKLAEAGL
jgi:DNA topoisomerase-6 subunit A